MNAIVFNKTNLVCETITGCDDLPKSIIYMRLFSKYKLAAIQVLQMGYLSCYALGALADQTYKEQWQYCAKPDMATFGSSKPRVPTALLGASSKQNIQLFADKISADKQQNFSLSGNVTIAREQSSLSADSASYRQADAYVEAQGDIRFEFENVLAIGESARFDLKERSGTIEDGKVWLLDKHLRGEAQLVTFKGTDFLQLEKASVTSCEEGSDDWRIRAAELKLNRATNTGTAKHARIELYNVPIFYLPYMSYPLSGRQTGFLTPHIGRSSVSGNTVGIPFYWNLAPHRDATFIPQFYDKRGTQLSSEIRYLNSNNQGQLNYDYLPNDKISDKDLSHLIFQHNGTPGKGWNTHIDYNYVSDDNYLSDFGSDLGVASTANLNREFTLSHSSKWWGFASLLQSYQTVDPTVIEPYQRLPQISFNTIDLVPLKPLNFKFEAEFVRFERHSGIIGTRYDLYPQFSLPISNVAAFITPKAGIRYTKYSLDREDPNSDPNPQRFVPIMSIDSGVFFERDATFLQQQFVQTLEPRLFYLYVPYRDQSSIIVDENGKAQTFDTSNKQFDIYQLFSENRFNGKDLIGDARQIGFSLTSRLLDTVGKERLYATIGQIFYFQDRQVVYPNGEAQTDELSDTLLEIGSNWNKRISSQFNFRWDTKNSEIGQGGLRLRYAPDRDRIVNLNYRYERKTIDQLELLVAWPFHFNWKPVLYWRYSILDRNILENYQGIEYNSCCWAMRVVRKDFIQDNNNRNISVLFELELKGLSSVGNKVRPFFGDSE